MGIALASLIMLSATTASFAPSLSEVAQGLGVLLVATLGLWLIATAPFRRGRRG